MNHHVAPWPVAARARPRGCIVGIEQRAPQARLICSPVEAAAFNEQADAALFHFTHDILRMPAAMDNVLRHLKPGARVVAAGLKWAAPGLAWPGR